MTKIVILGRKSQTGNYETFFRKLPARIVTTLVPGEAASCDALILPGGGDITPAFFGERSKGSRSVDTELDILQFQALDTAVAAGIPVIGICKGMQVINVAFGGTITQDLPTATRPRYENGDQYHKTLISESSCLHELYGREMTVNSAHHQGVARLGNDLLAIQWCPDDGCVEALIHEHLPILGLQWHPERLDAAVSGVDGSPVLSLLSAWIYAFRERL
mgnify:CR=1 FL=1